MKTIEYRAVLSSAMSGTGTAWHETEIIRVRARNINSGYAKALKLALVPLGNGQVREIARIEFWQVT